MGGDGKRYLDYDLIVKTYNQVKCAKTVAKLLSYSEDQVRKVLHENDFDLKANKSLLQSKPIAKCDKETGEILEVFSSAAEAGRSINKPKSHIGSCATGKRKSAYGFIWKHI